MNPIDISQSHPATKHQQNFKKLAENYMNAKNNQTVIMNPNSHREKYGASVAGQPTVRPGGIEKPLPQNRAQTSLQQMHNSANTSNVMTTGRKTHSNVKASQFHPLI